jgi:hypothetical protein
MINCSPELAPNSARNVAAGQHTQGSLLNGSKGDGSHGLNARGVAALYGSIRAVNDGIVELVLEVV